MTNVHKNFISFLLGCLFSYLSVWFSGIGAAAPVPEFLRDYEAFTLFFYSNMVIVLAAGIFAYLIILMVRKIFTLFTKQNLFCFAVPIVLFVISMLIFMGLVVAPLLYAAISTLLVAALLTSRAKAI
jgi:hypothetical protein